MKCILAPFNPTSVSHYFDPSVKLPNVNTTATSVNNLVNGLLKLGEQLLIVTTDISERSNSVYTTNNVTIIVVGCYRRFVLSRLFPNLHCIAGQIYEALTPYLNDISLVHAHWCYEYALAALRFNASIPILCTVRDWAPVIYRSINPLNSLYSFFAKSYWRYKMHIMKVVLASKRITFIANSEYTYNLLSSQSIHSSIIHNSINAACILDSVPSLETRNSIISIAGSLDDRRKNIERLVEAFEIINKNNKNIILILVGNYNPSGRVYKLVKNKGLLTNVRFLGKLSRAEVIRQLDSAFCMIHPALEETFGNIFLEAMARGCFCIGGENSGSVPYVLSDGKFGILCDVTSPQSIVNAYNGLVKELSSYEEMRKEALSNVKSNYSSETIARKHIRLYTQSINVFSI